MTQPYPTPNVPQYRPWKVSVPLPRDADLSPETLELLSQGAPLHVLRMFAGAEDIFPAIVAFIRAIFTAKGIDPKLREIIILRTAHLDQYCLRMGSERGFCQECWADRRADGRTLQR